MPFFFFLTLAGVFRGESLLVLEARGRGSQWEIILGIFLEAWRKGKGNGKLSLVF